MALHTITIANCIAAPDPLDNVHACDLVKFCSNDQRYWVTGLDKPLRDVPDPLEVPAGGCTGYYTVIGKKKGHPYGIIGKDTPCPPHTGGPPEIIIVD